MRNSRIQNLRVNFKSRLGGKLAFACVLALILPILVLSFNDDDDKTSAIRIVTSPHRASFFGLQNYGKFSHSVRAHADTNCNSCHQRNDNSITPQFAGHSACINCHLTQFLTPQTQMCAICHSNVQSSPAPMRAFPTNFKENFNMKFDHAVHNTGDGRPGDGCVACHQPLKRGSAALSIPANLNAHNQCYSCHTPNRVVGGRDIGSCSVCHSIGGYRRTSTNAAAFQASFSHAAHGSRQKLSCSDCHTIKAGAAQSRQVSSPIVAQHFSSNRAMKCMTCHNDQRAFGDRNFGNCKLCHTKASFQMTR